MPMVKLLSFSIFCLIFLSWTGQNIRAEAGQTPEFNLSDTAKVNSLLEFSRTVSADSALLYIDSAKAICKDNDFKKLLASCYHEAGTVFRSISVYDKALENYFTSLRISEDLLDSAAMAESYSNIGNVHLVTTELDDALDYFQKSREINEKLEDQFGVMVSYINTGAAYQKQRQLEKAKEYYRQALVTANENDFAREEAILTGNIGSSFMIQGELDSAQVYLEKALKLKEKLGNTGSTIHTLNDLSDLMYRMDRPEDGVAYAERALRLSRQTRNGNQLKYSHLNLSRNSSKLGQFESAYENLLEYVNVNDSLFGIEKAEQFKELEVKYETEKKDQAIASLEREREIASFRTRVYLLIGFLVLVIAAVLFNWQRQKARKNRELLEKEKEVDRLKADFFANISHEFRTPLTLILSPIETMLEQEPNPRQKNQLGIMKKSATRLLHLINQILDLSKLEVGQLKLQAQKVDLVPVAKGVAMSFESLAEVRKIEIEFESNCEELPVFCDVAKIETVLINLVSNAIKFTDENGRVKVSVNKLDESGGNAGEGVFEIKVSDSGKGISKEKIPHVFDRFYQGDEQGNRANKGSGIGLSLTRELVELHSGTIQVQSEAGSGTTFTVKIPMGKSHIAKDQLIGEEVNYRQLPQLDIDNKSSAEFDIEKEDDSRGDKPIVLLIEDNDDVRNYVRSIMEKDYLILEAADGVEGLEKARNHIPDLIISDVMMPEMDGYELCRRLKKDEKTSHVPVILLTAKTSVDSRITGLETEADMYLSKPFVPKELMVCVNNLIHSRKKLRERYNREVRLKPSEISFNSVDEQFLQRLLKVVEEHFTDPDFSVEQLGREVGMSRSQIHRKLHALTNESSSRFIRSFRLQRAMEMLQQKAGTVSEISYQVGFNSPSYFNKCFLEHFGKTPSSVLGKGSAQNKAV